MCFFATINQMFSVSSQLQTVVLLCSIILFDHCMLGSSVKWEDSSNTWLTEAKTSFVGWALNFGVHVIERHSKTSMEWNCNIFWHTDVTFECQKSYFWGPQFKKNFLGKMSPDSPILDGLCLSISWTCVSASERGQLNWVKVLMFAWLRQAKCCSNHSYCSSKTLH